MNIYYTSMAKFKIGNLIVNVSLESDSNLYDPNPTFEVAPLDSYDSWSVTSEILLSEYTPIDTKGVKITNELNNNE